jgi:hypothetical protein
MVSDDRAQRDRRAALRRLVVLPLLVVLTFGAMTWWNARTAERERPRVELFVNQVVDAMALDDSVVPPALAMSHPTVAGEVARRVRAAVRAAGTSRCIVQVMDGDSSESGGEATHTAYVMAPGGPVSRIRLLARAGDPVILVIGVEDAPRPSADALPRP